MHPTTALQIYDRQDFRCLSFGCKLLDEAIGGIPNQGITEISGEAGCGKTQLCLTLALQCKLPYEAGGLNGSTAYMSCGEGEFPIRRLSQLASAYENRTSITASTFLESVHIEQCHTIDDAFETLNLKLSDMCMELKVKLVIIDSVAGIIRSEYGSNTADEMKTRTGILFRLSSLLKRLADTYKVCIVIVNQVTGSGFDKLVNNHIGFSDMNLSSDTVPALGLAWSHCINTRIFVQRNSTHIRALDNFVTATSKAAAPALNYEHAKLRESNDTPLQISFNSFPSEVYKSVRYATLGFSAFRAASACKYEIKHDGVFGINL